MEMLLFSTYLLLTFSFNMYVNCDVILSFADLEEALHAEKDVALGLMEYVKMEKLRLEELSSIAHGMLSHSESGIQNEAVPFLGNPINSHLLVEHLTKIWTNAEENMKQMNNENVFNFFSKTEKSLKKFPDRIDFLGSVKGILRLQDTYSLSTSQLASGRLPGVDDAPPLSSKQCFEIGKVAYSENDFFHSTLWMEEAKEQHSEEYSSNFEIPVILDYLSFSVFKQGDTAYALNLTNQWLEYEPDNVRAIKNKEGYIKVLKEDSEYDNEESISKERNDSVSHKRHLHGWETSKDFENYEKLCRDDVIARNTQYLTCYYAHPHEYFILRPLKAERMHHSPDIYMFHDVLTDSEIEEVKRLAHPKLARSGVFSLVGQKEEEKKVTDNRVSKTAWLNDYESPVIAKLSKKISILSQLSVETAEALQVLNYGLGGHYTPHWDFVRPEEVSMFDENQGNRIATVFFYMTDVQAGGATVFPRIGVRLKPQKGAVGLWYNLLKNGDGDYNTIHAACPVLTGLKWACNKWIHARGQEFRRPCELDSFA